MQIIMFLVLGLLVTPTEVADMSVMSMGFLISFCLMFVARPVAVFAGMMFSRFNWREKLFVSWTGLRGAVPIILATYPLTAGHPQARYMFNVIFFVVLTSVMLQGKTLAWFAKFLGIDAEVREAKTWTLNFDITPASGTDETREVDLPYDAAVIGMAVKDLRFPDGVTILLINRGDKYLIPKGGTVLERDDTLLIFGDRAKLPGVVRKLSQPAENDSKDA